MNEYKHSSNLQIKSLLPLGEKVRMRGRGRGRTGVHRIFTRGFTLIELLVVVLIIGILAALGYPQYLLTVETSKARDAVALVTMAGSAQQRYAMDHAAACGTGGFNQPSTYFTNTCNTASCIGDCKDECDLVACGYLPKDDYDAKPYNLYFYKYTPGATVERQSGAPRPYRYWGYQVDSNGVVTSFGFAPAVPQ
jgi:prepilin-type N-terminal cleavage/methylation domain-containing protein